MEIAIQWRNVFKTSWRKIVENCMSNIGDIASSWRSVLHGDIKQVVMTLTWRFPY